MALWSDERGVMKIALVTSTLYGQGAEFVVAALARGLFRHGHEVEIWVCKIHEDMQRQHPELRPFDIPSEVTVRVMPSRRARYNIMFMRERIRHGGYDCVMCHASNYAVPLALAGYGLTADTKLVNVVHSGGVGTTEDGDLIGPTWSFRSWLTKMIIRNYDAQFSVSSGTTEAIHRMTGYPLSKLRTVYNPVLDENFKVKVGKTPQHRWLKDPQVPTFVAAGAFCRVKNYEMLLEAFARVHSAHQCRLVIFGKGPLEADYRALAEKLGISTDVDFPGFTNQLPAEMKNAAAVLVSSYQESFSVVLVEALAVGTPVVATDCPYGPREILEGGKHGLLVKNHDVEAMAEGLRQVLADRMPRPDPGCVSRFTADAVVARYEDALQTIMRKK